MDRITDAFPAPRLVRFGGRSWPVPVATLADLVALQAWVDRHTPDPWADAWAVADDPSRPDGERDRALYEALDAAGDGPPAYDSPAGWSLLSTAAGVVFFAGLALRRGTPGLTDGDVAAALAAATPAEYAALRRAFWGVDDADAAERRLTDHLPRAAPSGRVLTWSEAVFDVAEAYRMDPRAVLALPLPTFAAARRGGKPAPESGAAVPMGRLAEAERLRAERYRRAYPEGEGG